MPTVGLKLWSINENYYDAAKALYERGVYDYIELYAVPDTCDTLSLWKGLQIPYVVHAPHSLSGLNFSLPAQASENRILALQAIEFADVLGAEKIIFHPGINGTVKETIRQLQQIGDPRILIENKPHLGLDGSTCVGSRPEDIRQIMDECGVGFCMDFGHAICAANSFGENHAQWLDAFGALGPAMYHLTDGDVNGELDSHLHLGAGGYPLAEFLARIDANKPITLETEKSNQDHLNDFKEDVEALRQWI